MSMAAEDQEDQEPDPIGTCADHDVVISLLSGFASAGGDGHGSSSRPGRPNPTPVTTPPRVRGVAGGAAAGRAANTKALASVKEAENSSPTSVSKTPGKTCMFPESPQHTAAAQKQISSPSSTPCTPASSTNPSSPKATGDRSSTRRTAMHAIVASLLVGQLLFPYQWRGRERLLRHSDEKVAGDLPGDIPVDATLNRQRAVRTRRSKRVSSRRYYPRELSSAALVFSTSDESRIAKHFGTSTMEKMGTDDEITRQYNDIHIETANGIDQSAAPQTSVPPPKISKDCLPDVQAQPTCNNVHESSMGDALTEQKLQSIHFGGTRNVWRVYEHDHPNGATDGKLSLLPPPSYALKTLRWKRSFDKQTYRFQEKEAVALDYLTGASGIVGIHNYCGTTLQSEYANRDTLSAFLKKSSGRILPFQLLQIAWRLAQGVANMHAERRLSRAEGEEGIRIIHRDLDASNIMLTKNHTDGTWALRLDDFNQAYVIKYRDSKGEICSYQEAFVCGDDGRRVDVRAPEECHDNMDKNRPSLSEKVDVYGLGTVLYYVLTHRRAYNLDPDAPGPAKEYPRWYRKKVLQGGYPQLPDSVESDQDEAVRSIVEAMKMAMAPDADARDHAQKIADFLLERLMAYVNVRDDAYVREMKLG